MIKLLTFICMIQNKIYNFKQFLKMGHIIKKRTKFIKGNFKPAWACLNGYLSTIGRYIPCKSYRHVHSSFYYPTKTTVFERNFFDYIYKKTIKNWLN